MEIKKWRELWTEAGRDTPRHMRKAFGANEVPTALREVADMLEDDDSLTFIVAMSSGFGEPDEATIEVLFTEYQGDE